MNQTLGPMGWATACELSKLYSSCEVVTGDPDYRKERPADLRVTPSFRHRRSSTVGRIFSWLAYGIHAFLKILTARRGSQVLSYTNPPILPPIVSFASRLRGFPYAVVVWDIYPEALIRLRGANPDDTVVRLWHRLNKTTYHHAALVVTLGGCMARTIQENHRIPVTVVPPWNSLPLNRGDGPNPFRQQNLPDAKFVVLFSGNMGYGHPLETVLDIAEYLKEVEGIVFAFVGRGARREWLAAEIERRNLTNCHTFDWQPLPMVPYSLTAGDLAVVTMEPEADGMMLPSRAYTFIDGELPILLVSGQQSTIHQEITEYGLGLSISPGEAEGAAAAILTLFEDGATLEALRLRVADFAAVRRRDSSPRQMAQKVRAALNGPNGEGGMA